MNALKESVGTAVDDRRHTAITHIASAISICDFRDQIAARQQDAQQTLKFQA